ncbi:MAG: hypothetical protein AAFU49_22015, partial [Pseudomonadota bacterium]
MLRWILLIVTGVFALGGTAAAEPAAKTLFGRAGVPSEHDPAPYGSYARGCIAGAMALRETKDTHRIKRSSTGASGYNIFERRTSESGTLKGFSFCFVVMRSF